MKFDLPERFWSKVAKTDGCWNWTGAKVKGYGRISWQGAGMLATRLIWISVNGPIPSQQCVCHRCDNPSCVRPDHLFLGSHLENIADMWAKRRGVPPATRHGEASNRAILTERRVCLIFGVLAELGRPFRIGQVADLFGVSRATMDDLVLGKTWRHVPRPAEFLAAGGAGVPAVESRKDKLRRELAQLEAEEVA